MCDIYIYISGLKIYIFNKIFLFIALIIIIKYIYIYYILYYYNQGRPVEQCII